MKDEMYFVKIIIDEIVRLDNILRTPKEKRHIDDDTDFLCFMPGLHGKGCLFIGRKGNNALYDLLKLFINDDPRFDMRDLTTPLKHESATTGQAGGMRMPPRRGL